MLRVRGLGLLVLLWVACMSAVAQEGAGRIEGRVVKDGQGVGAVSVLINELKKIEFTDEDGRFTFTKLPPGSYTLIFNLGENTAARPVIVTAERPMQFEMEVDWELGVQEKVTVTAGAAQAAKIVDAPAAVTSITAVQIEREAAHGQVPKVLEFTPGAEVTQSGLYDFNFNTRGFNSSLNRRVSTYIDGRDVGVVLLGAQEWAAISGGLDDVANLEFIRGPSAALYGANASSGVVNITTKAPRESLGSMVRVTGGFIDTLSPDPVAKLATDDRSSDGAISFRHAGKLDENWYFKVLGGARHSGDFTVSRNPDDVDLPEYYIIEPADRQTEFCMNVGNTDCLPAEKTLFREQDDDILFGAVRLDRYFGKGLMSIEAGASNIKGPVFQTGIGRVQIKEAKRPFYRFNYSTPRWSALAHFSSRKGDQANLNEALIINFELITDTQRYGAEFQRNWDFAAGKGRFVLGAAHTEERVDTAAPDGRQTVVYQPISTNRQAIFSQLDYRVNDAIKLVFAGRVDKNTLHDTQFSPKAAMVYSINPKNSLRFTYNQAFQVANYSEFFLHTRIARFPMLGFASAICSSPALPAPVDCGITADAPILAVGNDDLTLEKTAAWEIGYSGLFANKVFMTVDYYNSTNKDFITDLVPQVGTILGDTNGCTDSFGVPLTDPRLCPINTDYPRWVSTPEAESTFFPFTDLTVAQALRNAVNNSVGGNSLGFRLAQDLNGATVVVGRTYTNVGEVDTQGIDMGLQYFINNAWSLQASYSWFDFEIVEPRPSPGITDLDIAEILLPNSPEHKASVALSFSKKRWRAGLSGRWVDGFRWSAGIFQGPVESYETADLTGSYTFNETVTVGLNVANLFDSVHRQTFGGDLLQRRALANVTFHW